MARYDAAVIGLGLGGLATAALLAARGRRVVVLAPGKDAVSSLGGLEKDGFTFAAGSSLLAACSAGSVIDRLFTDAGAGALPGRPATVYQVALPDRRISIYGSRDGTLDELRHEFPGDGSTLERFRRDLEKAQEKIGKGKLAAFFARNKTAASFLRTYSFSRELRCFFALLSNYFFRLPLEKIALTDLIELFLRVPHRSYGLHADAAQSLINGLTRSGGEIRFEEGTAEVMVKGHRSTGVKTSAGELDARNVVVSIPAPDQTVLFAGIRETVIPVGMEKDVLYLPDYARPDEFLSLSLSDEQDVSAAPAGMRAMTCAFNNVSASCPKETLINRVGGLIPFFTDFLTVSERKASDAPAPATSPMQFKSIHTGEGAPVLFHAAAKGLYRFTEDSLSPLQHVRAAYKLAKKIG